LCQGTGSYFFDVWCDNILEAMQSKWGKKTLTFTAHDENVFCVRNRESAIDGVTGLIKESLAKINKDYNLRRELGCDVQIGKNYAEIH
jgi:DNA polymerase I-like protein with 3'-5' exonuclease and polymerase domains